MQPKNIKYYRRRIKILKQSEWHCSCPVKEKMEVRVLKSYQTKVPLQTHISCFFIETPRSHIPRKWDHFASISNLSHLITFKEYCTTTSMPGKMELKRHTISTNALDSSQVLFLDEKIVQVKYNFFFPMSPHIVDGSFTVSPTFI